MNYENNEFDDNASLIWEEKKDKEKQEKDFSDHKKNYKFFGLFLIIVSSISFTGFDILFEPNESLFFSLVFILSGLFMVYKSLGTYENFTIHISSVLFLSGVFNFVFDEFYIINGGSFIFGITIIILGSAFLILFINTGLQKYSFYGVTLILFSAATIIFFRDSIFNFYLSNIIIRLLDYWEMVVVIIGVNYLIKYR